MIEEFNFCCCCGKKPDAGNWTAKAKTPAKKCDGKKAQSCRDECCSKDRGTSAVHAVDPQPAPRVVEQVDIESAAAREHVVIAVTGMTCTGCSRKMENVLKDIHGLYKPQVTFVSGTAAFDLDTKVAEAKDILPLIEKRTGFKLSRVRREHQQLDVLLSEDAAAAFNRSLADGVISLEKVRQIIAA